MTKYTVLRNGHLAGLDVSVTEQPWYVMGEVEAATPEAAIRATVADDGQDGKYVAVPSRSWNPIEVKLETTRVIRLGKEAVTA